MKHADKLDQDQTATSVQPDLDLHCPQQPLVLSSVRKELKKQAFRIIISEFCRGDSKKLYEINAPDIAYTNLKRWFTFTTL